MRWLVLGALSCSLNASANPPAAQDFSPYILKATEQIARSQLGKGYARSASFSRDLAFGKTYALRARQAPLTMCVGATLEVIVTALEMYAKETGDYSPFSYLPTSSWERLRPVDLRGQIWLVKNSASQGTAHALQKFGMGTIRDFRQIKPGAFVNLNRNNRTGHAVIFLGYLDAKGELLQSYDSSVAGFKYFSSQGNEQSGGFGFRYAFFSDVPCPSLPAGMKRDCGVIRSFNSLFLNAGVMWHPASWIKAKALDQLSKEAYHLKHSQTEMLTEGDYDAIFFSGETTDN